MADYEDLVQSMALLRTFRIYDSKGVCGKWGKSNNRNELIPRTFLEMKWVNGEMTEFLNFNVL